MSASIQTIVATLLLSAACSLGMQPRIVGKVVDSAGRGLAGIQVLASMDARSALPAETRVAITGSGGEFAIDSVWGPVVYLNIWSESDSMGWVLGNATNSLGKQIQITNLESYSVRLEARRGTSVRLTFNPFMGHLPYGVVKAGSKSVPLQAGSVIIADLEPGKHEINYFTNMGIGSETLSLRKGESVELLIEPSADDITIGKVVDEQDSALSGALLSIEEDSVSFLASRHDGSFFLPKLLEPRKLRVSKRGYESQFLQLAPDSGPLKVTLIRSRTGDNLTVRGSVPKAFAKAECSGGIMPTEKVLLWGKMDWNVMQQKAAEFDKEGKFIVQGLEPGEYHFRMACRGSNWYHATVQAGEDLGVVPLVATSKIYGRLMDASTGKPVDRFGVSLEHHMRNPMKRREWIQKGFPKHPDGRFELATEASDTNWVCITTADIQKKCHALPYFGPRDTTFTMNIQDNPVEILVKDSEGKPAQGVFVQLQPAGEEYTAKFQLSAKVKADLEKIPEPKKGEMPSREWMILKSSMPHFEVFRERTDSSGIARLYDLPDGVYHLLIQDFDPKQTGRGYLEERIEIGSSRSLTATLKPYESRVAVLSQPVECGDRLVLEGLPLQGDDAMRSLYKRSCLFREGVCEMKTWDQDRYELTLSCAEKKKRSLLLQWPAVALGQMDTLKLSGGRPISEAKLKNR